MNDVLHNMSGIIVPLVTPLESADRIDIGALELLIERVVGAGVNGVFLLGTCGEGASLSYDLRRAFIAQACRLVDRRVPVLVSVSDTSPRESDALAASAADVGADVAVAAPPYYLPMSQHELCSFFLNRTTACPLPLLLYNMPELTKVVISAATVRRLMDEPAVIGLKDSSGDLDYFSDICAMTVHRPGWPVFMGPEHLLVDSIRCGGSGGVCGGANIVPELFVDLYRDAVGSGTRSPRLRALVAQLGEIYSANPPSAASVIKGLKHGLACLGIGNGRLAEPLGELTPAEKERIGAVIQAVLTDAAIDR